MRTNEISKKLSGNTTSGLSINSVEQQHKFSLKSGELLRVTLPGTQNETIYLQFHDDGRQSLVDIKGNVTDLKNVPVGDTSKYSIVKIADGVLELSYRNGQKKVYIQKKDGQIKCSSKPPNMKIVSANQTGSSEKYSNFMKKLIEEYPEVRETLLHGLDVLSAYVMEFNKIKPELSIAQQNYIKALLIQYIKEENVEEKYFNGLPQETQRMLLEVNVRIDGLIKQLNADLY